MTELQLAVKNLLEYFESSNDLPVEKATIRSDSKEVRELKLALSNSISEDNPDDYVMQY